MLTHISKLLTLDAWFAGPVWKVARYTSAAPVLFGESDEYVDGGILANNPSESGLSRIQDYYRKRGEKLPISLVVSIGCGKYPIKKLGSVDFLFAGSGGLHLAGLKDGTSNFLSLLQYAVSVTLSVFRILLITSTIYS